MALSGVVWCGCPYRSGSINPVTLVTVSAEERPDLVARAAEVTADVWPEYNRHGDVVSTYWHTLDETFAAFQFVLWDS